MTDGFKMKELVHAGDQAGVPDTMRAVDTKQKKAGERDPELRRQLIIRHIREHQGDQMTIEDLTKAAGLVGVSAALNYVRRLTQEGKIVRKKLPPKGLSSHRFTYELVDGRRNGPVTVVKPPEPELQTDIEQSLMQKREVMAGLDASFVSRTDRELWEFLRKSAERLGYREATKILSEYSNHLHQTLLGEAAPAVVEEAKHE